MRKYYKYYKVVRVDSGGMLMSAIMVGWQAMAYEENVWSHDPRGLGIFLYKDLSQAIRFADSFRCSSLGDRKIDRREVWEVEATGIIYKPLSIIKRFEKVLPELLSTSLILLDPKDPKDMALVDGWALAKHVKLTQLAWRW